MFISYEWRMLKDGEKIEEDDMCFGTLPNGQTGWGKPPAWLVGQAYCDGWTMHPDFIARRRMPPTPQDTAG